MRLEVALLLAALSLGCSRGASPAPPRPAASPALRCMVYRACGCEQSCAGVEARGELRTGQLLEVLAGPHCGARARVQTALGPDGRLTLALTPEERCERTCGLEGLRPVNPAACEGACVGCPARDR